VRRQQRDRAPTPTVVDPAVLADLPPMFPGGNRIGRAEEEAVLETLRAKRLFRYYGVTDGRSPVAAFEAAFAARMGTRHALAVSSGTAALATALAAAGVGPGDEVIVPAYTWVSTAAAVLAVGGIPTIAEVDGSLGIDVADAESLVDDRTRAIIPVHMRGAAADMTAVMEMARRHGLVVIEDVAQALGGSFRGRPLGSLGDIGCFSLQFNKIITCGEGGLVITDDPRLHERALLYHDVAASQRADLSATPAFYGLTCRMTELQGAVAGAQLERLEGILADCRSNRALLVEAIAEVAAQKGLRLRATHDEAGDTAIALVLLCPQPATAQALVRSARAAGLPVRRLYDPAVSDLHVASSWAPILERRSWSARGPWSAHSPQVHYGPDRWTRTTDLLGRAVHLDVSPDLHGAQLAAIAGVLREAIAQL
jgi:8-amino-3,8-dideoxy-alpha-D-manno-octulosonate transaminase